MILQNKKMSYLNLRILWLTCLLHPAFAFSISHIMRNNNYGIDQPNSRSLSREILAVTTFTWKPRGPSYSLKRERFRRMLFLAFILYFVIYIFFGISICMENNKNFIMFQLYMHGKTFIVIKAYFLNM